MKPVLVGHWICLQREGEQYRVVNSNVDLEKLMRAQGRLHWSVWLDEKVNEERGDIGLRFISSCVHGVIYVILWEPQPTLWVL